MEWDLYDHETIENSNFVITFSFEGAKDDIVSRVYMGSTIQQAVELTMVEMYSTLAYFKKVGGLDSEPSMLLAQRVVKFLNERFGFYDVHNIVYDMVRYYSVK